MENNNETFEMRGNIKAVLPRGEFKVTLEEKPEVTVHCRPSGKMRKFYIKMVEGDKVMVRMTPYDLSKGVITFRGWNNNKK